MQTRPCGETTRFRQRGIGNGGVVRRSERRRSTVLRGAAGRSAAPWASRRSRVHMGLEGRRQPVRTRHHHRSPNRPHVLRRPSTTRLIQRSLCNAHTCKGHLSVEGMAPCPANSILRRRNKIADNSTSAIASFLARGCREDRSVAATIPSHSTSHGYTPQ